MTSQTAEGRWMELHGARSGFIDRCERYASYTLPYVCQRSGYDQNNEQTAVDYQSVGAQSVNHLTNKLVLSMFAPSRPFLRLEASEAVYAEAEAAGITEAEIKQVLSKGELRAIKHLDASRSRPELYEALKHLIITGNGLIDASDDQLLFYGIKDYVVRRNIKRKPIEIIVKTEVEWGQLEEEVRGALPLARDTAATTCLYRWYKKKGGTWRLTQYVDGYVLPEKFGGEWKEDKFPLHPITWLLSGKNDYGTGLVEEYAADFGALSAMSQAQVEAGIMASEFRWLLSPRSSMSANDFKNSRNGDAIPGEAGDLNLVSAANLDAVQAVTGIAQQYIQRIGRAFLLGSAVTRDAERVTAEEIRMQAVELESALGGVYSRLAIEFQLPIARWLLREVKVKVSDKEIAPVIVTGLDALSRSGDLDNLQQFLNDVIGLTSLPPEIQARLKLGPILTEFAANRHLDPQKYLEDEETAQATLQSMQQPPSQEQM